MSSVSLSSDFARLPLFGFSLVLSVGFLSVGFRSPLSASQDLVFELPLHYQAVEPRAIKIFYVSVFHSASHRPSAIPPVRDAAR